MPIFSLGDFLAISYFFVYPMVGSKSSHFCLKFMGEDCTMYRIDSAVLIGCQGRVTSSATNAGITLALDIRGFIEGIF